MAFSISFNLRSFLDFVLLWISNAPMQGLDLAIWCAVATSARLELSGIALDEVLDPVSWDYRHSTGVSLFGYCLSLSRHRLDMWASEWAAASTLWEELFQFAQSTRADMEICMRLAALRARSQDILLVIRAAAVKVQPPCSSSSLSEA